MLRKYLDLPELSLEPQIIKYADNSFTLNWWQHQIYRFKSDELFDHEIFITVKGTKHHLSYIEG